MRPTFNYTLSVIYSLSISLTIYEFSKGLETIPFTVYQVFGRIINTLLTSSPPWKGRGFPSRGLIVPTIDSGLHLSFGGQSSGSENHSHLKMGLSLPSSSPLKEKENDDCSSHSPIKPSIKLGKSVVSITKRNFNKEVFKYKGAIHPRWRGFPSP